MPINSGITVLIDLTVASNPGSRTIVNGTDRPTQVASVYVADGPPGWQLLLSVGQGDLIPLEDGNIIGIEADDMKCDPMSGGIYYSVPVAQAGKATLVYFPTGAKVT